MTNVKCTVHFHTMWVYLALYIALCYNVTLKHCYMMSGASQGMSNGAADFNGGAAKKVRIISPTMRNVSIAQSSSNI